MTERIEVAAEPSWGWKTCVVCGSEDVTEAGMIIMVPEEKPPYIARIAWCSKEECVADSEQTNFTVVTAEEVKKIDTALAEDASTEFKSGYDAALADMRWLANARDQYTEERVQFQTKTVRNVADIMDGSNDASGWLPSWLWDEWASKREGSTGEE